MKQHLFFPVTKNKVDAGAFAEQWMFSAKNVLWALLFTLPLLHSQRANAQIYGTVSVTSDNCGTVCLEQIYSAFGSSFVDDIVWCFDYNPDSYNNAFVDGGLASSICHTYTSPGTYIIATEYLGSQEELYQTTVTVSDIAYPGTITLTLPAICTGSGTTALSNGDAGGAWSSSDTTVAKIDADGNITGVSAGVADITYTVSNSCGTNSASGTVTVNPLPYSGTVSIDRDFLCANTTVETNSDGNTGGVWSSNNDSIIAVDSLGHVSGQSAGTAIITYTVSNSCGTAAASDTILVIPMLHTGTLSISSPTVCLGGEVTVTTSGDAGGVWLSNDSTIAIVDSLGNVNGISAGTAYILYQVGNACSSQTTDESITVIPLPNAGTLTAGSGVICQGSIITATSNGDTGGQWSGSSVDIATIDLSGNITGISAGIDTIAYMVNNACGASTATDVITIAALPTPTITKTDSILSTQAFSSYQWLSDGAAISGATSQTYKMQSNGNYSVVVTNAEGCSDTSVVANVTTLAISEVQGITDIRIYPNPAQTIVYIDAPENVNVTLTGADGRLLLQLQQVKNIDISNFPNGVYLVEIYNRQGLKLRTCRIVKIQ